VSKYYGFDDMIIEISALVISGIGDIYQSPNNRVKGLHYQSDA